MPRRALLLLTVAAALAAPAGASAATKPFTLHLTACHHAVSAVDRYLRTTATVRLVPRSSRIVLRYQLLWRPAGAAAFSRYPSAPFARSFRKASEHVYTVGNLPSRAGYKLDVRARWTGGGRVVHTEHRVTQSCYQPDARPDLKVARFVKIGPRRYDAIVRNVGLTAAGPFDVGDVREPGLAPGQSVRVAVRACATVTVDPGNRVDERDESNNWAQAPCPSG